MSVSNNKKDLINNPKLASKLVVWGIGEEYEKQKSKGIFSGIRDSVLLVDKYKMGRDFAKPSELNPDECAFIYIATKKYFNEIKSEIMNMGLLNMIIPMDYTNMQHYRDRYYGYLSCLKTQIEDNENIDIVQEWNEYSGRTSCIIRIKNSYKKNLKIYFFGLFMCSNIDIINVRSEKCIKKISLKNDIQSVMIDIDSASTLLKLTCNGFNVPHIRMEILETSFSNKLSQITQPDIRKIFITWLNRLSTNFSFHENDYLLFRNFDDVIDLSIIDCGANYGQSILSFLYSTKYMKVYSFEADPILIPILRILERSSDRLIFYPYGVSDEISEMEFYYCEELREVTGSFLKEFWKDLLSENKIQHSKTKCVSVDSVIDKSIEINFIKIDVEGYEYKAVLGMKEIIKRCRPILLIERNPKNLSKLRTLLSDDYTFWVYDYTKNKLYPDNNDNDDIGILNYWCLPKKGNINPKVNEIMYSLCVNKESNSI